MTAFTDGLVLTAYTIYLLRAAVAAVFNQERWAGNR
jgi:hypothetical protein